VCVSVLAYFDFKTSG